MKIELGPRMGNIVKGSLYDINQKYFDARLKDIDELLYSKWNPNKNKGQGVWEIRRKPANLSIKDITEFEGNTYIHLDYVEYNLVHHVLDVPAINYFVLNKLRSMDTYAKKNWVEDLERRELEWRAEKQRKAREDMHYAMKQNKHFIKAWKEMLLSGSNPAEIARYWNKRGS